MNAIPAPDPLPVPAPTPLLWGLLMLTFFLHLLAMNFVLGGSIIGAIARLRGDERSHGLTSWLGKFMPVMVAAAVTFGVAPLLFLQTIYGRLFFTSSVLMAWSWLAVVPILIFAYYGVYLVAFKQAWARWLAPIIAILFLGIAFIYSNNMSLMLRPGVFQQMYSADARGLQLNLADPTLVPRYLHMVLGALAVAGMIVALYGLVKKDAWAMRHGTLWFGLTTCLNVLAGIWWLGVLPRVVLADLMRSPWLIAGIVFGFVALGAIPLTLASKQPRTALFIAAGSLTASLVAMIFTRDEVRRGMLQIAQFKMSVWVEPQWTIIAVFAVLLVAALGTTAWMASLLARKAAV